jgi:hypothetical protein
MGLAMKRMASIVVAVTFVGGCASGLGSKDVVRDAPTAIQIGMDVCGKDAGSDWRRDNPVSNWRATLSGDYWDVSEPEGPRYPSVSVYSVRVAKHDGKTSDCIFSVA